MSSPYMSASIHDTDKKQVLPSPQSTESSRQQIIRQAQEQLQQLDGASSVADVAAPAAAADDPEIKKKLSLLAILLKAIGVMAVAVVAGPVIAGVAAPVAIGAATKNLGGQ